MEYINKKIRIFLVDDHSIYRLGLKTQIENHGYQVVGKPVMDGNFWRKLRKLHLIF